MKYLIPFIFLIALSTQVSIDTLFPNNSLPEQATNLEGCYTDLLNQAADQIAQIAENPLSTPEPSTIRTLRDTVDPVPRTINQIIRITNKRLNEQETLSIATKLRITEYLSTKLAFFTQAFLRVETFLGQLSSLELALSGQLQLLLLNQPLSSEDMQTVMKINTNLRILNRLRNRFERLSRRINRILTRISNQIVRCAQRFLNISLLQLPLPFPIQILQQPSTQTLQQQTTQISQQTNSALQTLSQLFRTQDLSTLTPQLQENWTSTLPQIQSLTQQLTQQLPLILNLATLQNPIQELSQSSEILSEFTRIISQNIAHLLNELGKIEPLIDLLVNTHDPSDLIHELQKLNPSDAGLNWISELISDLEGSHDMSGVHGRLSYLEQIQQTLQGFIYHLHHLLKELTMGDMSLVEKLADILNQKLHLDGENEIVCPAPDFCLPQFQLDECNALLGLLDGESKNNTSITNECRDFVKDGEQFFEFKVTYLAPFVFDENCLTQTVKFEGQELPEGTAMMDEFSFDGESQMLVFNIALKDFVDKYGCEFTDDGENYVFNCDMSLHILFGPFEQLMYMFKLQAYYDRMAGPGPITVVVEPNDINNDNCCENQLDIETNLRVCTDINCDSYIDPPITIIRKEEFIVEHSIVTNEFKNYLLSKVSVTLGTFFPEIVSMDDTQPGRIIYVLRSNIAKPDLILQVISLLNKPIENGVGGGGRFLMTGEEEKLIDDYRIKGVTQLSILTPLGDIQNSKIDSGKENNEVQNEFQSQVFNEDSPLEKEASTASIMVIGAIVFVVLVSIFILIGVRCYLNKERRKQQYEEEKKQTSFPIEKSETESQL